ncbi:MAG: DinB family protein [Bacteroidota bacterium]
MTLIKKWFERKFQTDTLEGTFLPILERLEGTPLRLKTKLESIPKEFLTPKPDGTWSILENAGHLNDLEPLWEGRIQDILQGQEELRPTDLTNAKTSESDHNAKQVAEIVEAFTTSRQRLVALCKANADHAETLSALHPRLKQPMRIIDLAFFVAEHDDHHLAIIAQLAENLGEKG